MKLETKLTVCDDRHQKFFGEGPARLLRQIEKTGSLRSAAISMEMAYSKASRLIRQAEESLGFPLTTRTTGGRDGGGSILTPEGLDWLSRYEACRTACDQANQALFRQYFPRKACVIMASGQSKRFGSNKLLADFQGEPLFFRALAATQGLFDQRIVVTRHAAVAELCRQQDVRVLLHDLPCRSDTVRLGLEAVEDAQVCLFCPADQPLLRRETIHTMLEYWNDHRERICRPVWENRPGAPVLFPEWTFEELKHLPRGMGGSGIADRYPEKTALIPVADPYELMDADTPQDLAFLRGIRRKEAYE